MLDNKKRLFIGKNKRKIAKEIIDKCKENIDDDLLTFDFISEIALRKRLVKRYREAIFVEKLINVLHISYTDSHPLNQIIITNYASIAEAVLNSKFIKANILGNIKTKRKIEKLLEMNVITIEIYDSIQELWDIRNHIHLMKSIDIKREFYKKHVANKQNVIFELCNSIEAYVKIDVHNKDSKQN